MYPRDAQTVIVTAMDRDMGMEGKKKRGLGLGFSLFVSFSFSLCVIVSYIQRIRAVMGLFAWLLVRLMVG